MQLKWPTSEQLLYAANLIAGKIYFNSERKISPSKILLVKLDEIGDMATASNVFELLRKQFPASKIDLLCKPFVAGLIVCDPNINGILTSEKEWTEKYDAIIELRGNWRTLLKAIRHRPAFRSSRASVRWQNRGRQLREAETNFQSIKNLLGPNSENTAPALYFSDSDNIKVSTYLEQNSIKKFAILHTGARRKLRQWNPERFAAAAEYLHKRYEMDIIFIGSKEEEADTDKIRAMIGFRTYGTYGIFSLSETACLCSKASFYLGNESGPLHIAAAFSVPMIALFGPGVPHVFYPVHPKSAVLHHVLPCNPCDQVHCVQPADPCISRIQTADVLIKMDEILQS